MEHHGCQSPQCHYRKSRKDYYRASMINNGNGFGFDGNQNHGYGHFTPIASAPTREKTPQLGYFVPLDTMCYLNPPQRTNRISTSENSSRSRRSISYGGSITPSHTISSHPPSPSSNETISNLVIDPTFSPPVLRKNLNKLNNGSSNNINNNSIGFNINNGYNVNNGFDGNLKNFIRSPITNRKHDRYSECYINPYIIAENFPNVQKRRIKRGKLHNRGYHSMTEAIEVLADQIVEDDPLGERTSWEYHTVIVTRVPGYGFGIAVSGGRDNPHFANGDPSIAVSDVLKGGPAEDRLQVNDRIITVNGVSLENVEYATAVQVLRDSGNTVNLVIKRRVPNLNMITTPNHQHTHSFNSTSGLGMGGATSPQQTIKLVLSKSNKKDDFGIVFGCRLFVKEISSKAREQLAINGFTLQKGDIVSRIHNTNCNDSMSLKEAKKIIESCKEKLNLVVLREMPQQTPNNNNSIQSPVYSHAAQVSNCSNIDEAFLPGGSSYSTQNLYVQPPTRPANSTLLDDKSNLTPRGRSRNPLMDVSLSQLDRPSTPQTNNHNRSRSAVDEPPRPPPPRGEDFYASRRQLYEDDPLQRTKQSAEPRFISFQKEGSVGIRLTGGNEVGIFVTAVQPGSPASLQGLTPGDKILKVNDMDMHGVTREEAVLFLLSLQDRIDLIVQHCKEEYDNVVANQRGDSFHIKTHFHYENPSKGEISFKAGDVFRVIDTLHNGVVGSWQVLRIGRGHEEMQRGVIPNKSRAEELATAQFNASKKEMNASESRGNFFRRRRSSHRRSKSLSRENWDDVVFSDSVSKFPAYERVVLRHPGFVRPVVMFGPTSDLARERLIKDFPDKFTAPLQDENKNSSKSGIVRLSNIRDIMDRGKHALLDITPNAVDRLNYAQFYPIVIFLKADSKHIIKQLRQGIPKSAHKSSKKLLEQCQKLDRIWSHVFSTTIILNDVDTWYRKLRDSIDQQQSGAVWMSETKPVESLSDDFLFPMTTSRLSYASSPESDLELSPGPSASLSLGNLPQLVKSSSDPSIATNQDNLDRDIELNIGEGMPPPYMHSYDNPNPNNRRPPIEGKYGFTTSNPNNNKVNQSDPSGPTYSTTTRTPGFGAVNQPIYGTGPAPDLPPRVDRASKPPGLATNLAQKLTLNQRSANQSAGSVSRAIHERLFASKKIENTDQDEYGMRSQFEKKSDNSIERTQNSGDIHREIPHKNNNGSYDSVSSYDSYNTTQISAQRLGPNAPDDLKSVPNTNGRMPPNVNPNMLSPPQDRAGDVNHNHSDSLITNRSSLHEHTRSLSNGGNDMNRQSSPGRPPYPTDRNISINPQELRSTAQRPNSLGLETTPKKLAIDTKTDYGKYSRNNSASQADYKTPPPSNQNIIGPPIGTPFKPVPPPKPKNYRPPVQGNSGPPGHWDPDEPKSPRSPNSFFYPPTSSHYHHNAHNSSPSGGHHNNGPPPMHQYAGGGGHPYPGNGNYSGTQNSFNSREAQMGNNGYNGNHMYVGQYMYRNNAMSNIPHHPSERHAIDLAGSREQRGSAFELYRKPQIGLVGHQHNIRRMDQSPSYYHHQNYMYSNSSSPMVSNEMNEKRQYVCDNIKPPLLPKQKKTHKLLKSPLTAIKNAIIRSTRPLRRQTSLIEPVEKIPKPSILRRQHSMMENRNRVRYYDEEEDYHYSIRHERFYPREYDYSHQNFETESIYGYTRDNKIYDYNQENMYANRALIDLERRQVSATRNPPQYGGRIVRRHSLAEKSSSYQNRFYNQAQEDENVMMEPIYQTRNGSYMMQETKHHMNYSNYQNEPSNIPNRKILHLDHLYQSKSEMLEKINLGRNKEVTRSESRNTDYIDMRNSPSRMSESPMKDNVHRNQSQLRDHIYQTRQETMKSMAEPLYISKRELKNEPIYESSKEDCSIIENLLKENEKCDLELNSRLDEVIDTIKLNLADDSKTEEKSIVDDVLEILNNEPYNCELTLSNDQSTENQNTVIERKTVEEETSLKISSPICKRSPYHISNIIKRTAPTKPHDVDVSRTSVETQYNSQASLIPFGRPNAQSTPYSSEMSIGVEGFALQQPPREPSTTRGIFTEEGGTLSDPIWKVSLIIPNGAIPKGAKQEIYFTVTDPRLSEHVGGPPLDMQNGETMLSPLVMCGPQGLEFLTPVTLNIPHCAANTLSLGLSLKATDSEKNLRTDWDNIELPSNTAAYVVSVKVDHF